MRFCFSFDHCFELDYCASLHSFGSVYFFIDSFLFFLDTLNYICFLMHFYFFFDPLPDKTNETRQPNRITNKSRNQWQSATEQGKRTHSCFNRHPIHFERSNSGPLFPGSCRSSPRRSFECCWSCSAELWPQQPARQDRHPNRRNRHVGGRSFAPMS